MERVSALAASRYAIHSMPVAQQIRVNPAIDVNDVLDILQATALHFPCDSAISNALVDALRQIEADIDTQMKVAQQ